MGQTTNEENEPLTAPYQRSPRPQFNYFYGSTTTGTTPPTSVHTDEQDSLVGEELIATDNECDIVTTDDEDTYQRDLYTYGDRERQRSRSSKTTSTPPTIFSWTPITIFLLMAGAAAVVVLLFISPQDVSVPLLSQSFVMPFPQIDRAEFGDPVEGFIDMDLFAPRLVRESSTGGENKTTQHSRSFSLPFPTGAFWTNLVVPPPSGDSLSFPIVVYPFAYRWSPSSLKVSYPAAHRVKQSKSISDGFVPELTLTTQEETKKRHIVDYDPLSVTLRYLSSSSSNSRWETSLVQGSPYITVSYTKQTPVLKPLSIFSDVQCPGDDEDDFSDLLGDSAGPRKVFGVCSIDKSDPKYTTMRGVQFVFKTQEGASWFMFTSEPVNLVFDKLTMTTITTVGPITGVIRLAYIPESDGDTTTATSTGVKRLIYHSDIYPVGADISYDFHRTTGSSSSTSRGKTAVDAAKSHATVTFKFATRSMLTNAPTTQTSKTKNLLMLALPHHAAVISDAEILDSGAFNVNYECIKGPMTPVVGPSWSFDEPLYDMQFDSPGELDIDDRIKDFILEQVEDDLDQVLPNQAENVYGYGKQVARLAQLVHIADKLETKSKKDGNTTVSSEDSSVLGKATKQLAKYLEKYLSSDVSDELLFDTNLGGICSKNGLMDKGEDFGNGRYNDHHFHYGYFLYASAVMAKIDPTFIDRYGGHVDALFHDVAYSSNGDSRDVEPDSIFFPMTRHKSWFDGHSFATGLFSFANGKSQESSSEAINCYYGAYLWSLVRHEEIASEVTDFSRLLLSTEIRSTKMYWHMIPPSVTGNSSQFHPHLYPAEFEENYMVGNLGMLDVNSNTWFGNDNLYVHMINAIPITAASNILFGEDYVKYEYPFLMEGRGSVEMAWRGYTVSIHSIIDPNKAWEDANALVSSQLDSALSKSQVLYFISQRAGFNITLNESTSKQTSGSSSSTAKTSSTTSSSSCDSHPDCAGLGLTGECCPTAASVFLGCCNS